MRLISERMDGCSGGSNELNEFNGHTCTGEEFLMNKRTNRDA